MRFKGLLLGDFKFQIKYGFYFIYAIITVLYLCLLFALPTAWREKAAVLMIFSDPAALGLFFMGAIILLEKSQRVLNSIAISPVKIDEYILSKALSLGVISTLSGLIMAFVARVDNLFLVTIAIFLGSVLFTMCGFIAAANVKSLNQFLIVTVPFEILIILPSAFYLFGFQNRWLSFHPGVSIIQLMTSQYDNLYLCLAIILIWIIGLYFVAKHIVKKMMKQVGGIKL